MKAYYSKRDSYSRPTGCSGQVVSALNSGSIGSGSSPDRGHCVVFARYSHSASLHPSVKMGTGKLKIGGGGNPVMD